jgi:hypothetical protein
MGIFVHHGSRYSFFADDDVKAAADAVVDLVTRTLCKGDNLGFAARSRVDWDPSAFLWPTVYPDVNFRREGDERFASTILAEVRAVLNLWLTPLCSNLSQLGKTRTPITVSVCETPS